MNKNPRTKVDAYFIDTKTGELLKQYNDVDCALILATKHLEVDGAIYELQNSSYEEEKLICNMIATGYQLYKV